MKYFAILLLCALLSVAMSKPQYRDPGTAPIGNVNPNYPGQDVYGQPGLRPGGNGGGRDPGTAPIGNVGGYRDPGRAPVGNVDPNFHGYGVANPNVYGRPGK